ncbi:hypothetical protein AA313_de0203724 [Arthrobotrys entomopaga]|nr:hypothetical protein AA313_de0203724 [Arthrobotrys entomopaga]
MFPLQTLIINIILITHLTLHTPVSAYYQIPLRSLRSPWFGNLPKFTSGVLGQHGNRDSLKIGECFRSSQRDRGDLSAMGIYNKPGLPMATAVAFYSNSVCGAFKSHSPGPPSYIAVLDPKSPGGVWVVNFVKGLGEPVTVASWKAIDYNVAIKRGGLLGGPQKSGSLYDVAARSSVKKGGTVKKVYGEQNKLNGLTRPGDIYIALRDATERAITRGSKNIPNTIDEWLFREEGELTGAAAADHAQTEDENSDPIVSQGNVPETAIIEEESDNIQMNVAPGKPTPKGRGKAASKKSKKVSAKELRDDSDDEPISELHAKYLDPPRYERGIQANFEAFLTDPDAPFPDIIEEEAIETIPENKPQGEIPTNTDTGYETPDEQRLVKGRPLEEIDAEIEVEIDQPAEVIDLDALDGRARKYEDFITKAEPWTDTGEDQWVVQNGEPFIVGVEDTPGPWSNRPSLVSKLLAASRSSLSNPLVPEKYDNATARRAEAFEKLMQSAATPEYLSSEQEDMGPGESSNSNPGISVETTASEPHTMEIESSEVIQEDERPLPSPHQRVLDLIRANRREELLQFLQQQDPNFQPANIIEPPNVMIEEIQNLQQGDLNIPDPLDDTDTSATHRNRQASSVNFHPQDPFDFEPGYGQGMSSSSRRRPRRELPMLDRV